MSTAIIILTLDEIDGVKVIVPKINKKWAEEIIFVGEPTGDDNQDEFFPHFKHKNYPDLKIETGMRFVQDGEIPDEKWEEVGVDRRP